MRYKYAILNDKNVVKAIINTPIEKEDGILIDEFDSNLLGAIYNKDTDEFTKELTEE